MTFDKIIIEASVSSVRHQCYRLNCKVA